MELTDTSYTFVKQTLKDTRREGVLRRRTRLLCQECGEVRQAIDVFPNGEVLMSRVSIVARCSCGSQQKSQRTTLRLVSVRNAN